MKSNFIKGQLKFSCDLSITTRGSDAAFIAVGTHQCDDGSADFKFVLEVSKEIGNSMTDDLLLITESTVSLGTAEKVRRAVAEVLD